jgi:hypothetical protein
MSVPWSEVVYYIGVRGIPYIPSVWFVVLCG